MTSSRWFIATNTENLKFFYDCGLIVDRQAFPNKSYMHDMQAERPKGFLPCLSEDNLSEALKLAKSEDENLIACLVEIELKNIRFEQLFVKSRNSREFECVDEKGFNPIDAVEILLPSPLPLSCIKSILLSDPKNQKKVVQEFLAFGEFSKDFFKNDAKLFKVLKPCNELAPELQGFQYETERCRKTVQLKDIPDHGLDYKKVFAYGNALFLGFYQTKNGRLSSELFEAFANNKVEDDKYLHLRPLASWVFDNQNESKLDSFYGLIFDLIVAEDELGTVRYDLLKLLDNKEDQLPSGYTHVSAFAKRLRERVDRTDKVDVYTYLFNLIEASKKEEKWSSKIFLLISMIFIRDNSETLLKFYHEQFTEEDYFLLAVFFGLIKGIRTTPEKIKNIVGLRDWVSFKMAELMHKSNSAAIVFEKEPSSPILIHKTYLRKSSEQRRMDALQKFCSHIKVDEAEVIAWKLVPKDEYKVNSGAITFSKRPSLYAEVDNKRFESLMLARIKETDELFSFNEVFKIFKD
ncbi:MAG TPA: hypothetical protein PKC44_04370 [Agitococcus sp.]|nr:hypothetical protein [Agitococcus sp.]HNG37247.1 hypothetical protein [Nitrosomonas sp.]